MLRRRLAAIALALLSGCATVASPPTSQSLVGTWKVDLRPKPGAPDYYKSLVVTAATATTFEGTFYDTPITDGRINLAWGAVRFAFTTEDRSGKYHHSAVLNGTKIEGLTNSDGRGFLAYWSATRE